MSTEIKETKLTNKEVEETLRDVIQSLIDGQEGFQKIGRAPERRDAQELFHSGVTEARLIPWRARKPASPGWRS